MITSEPPAWPLMKANTSLPAPPVIVEAPLPPRTLSAPEPSVAIILPVLPKGFVAIVSAPDVPDSLMPVIPALPETARLLAPLTETMVLPVPPTKVELAPETVPTKPPAPPETELPEPEAVKCVTPELAPKIVDALEALTVSFGAAKTELGVVIVMLLLPPEVSATAVAPLMVDTVFADEMTAGPLTVDAPEAASTVNVVLELKKLFRVAAAPPVNCWATVAPLTVGPLML
jgi:hypothetical protein